MDYSWQRPTRLLHLGLAVTVTAQLVLSLFMWVPTENPDHSAAERSLLQAHVVVGLCAALIVLFHWLWTLTRAGDGSAPGVLFPWRRTDLPRVIADAGDLIRGKLPPVSWETPGLAGFVHGLGLFAVTAMVVTGVAMFVVIQSTGLALDSAAGRTFAAIHAFVSTFVWIYWGGHILMALWHQFAGHKTITAMFTGGGDPSF